jgi:hypothetical protein
MSYHVGNRGGLEREKRERKEEGRAKKTRKKVRKERCRAAGLKLI